MERSFYLITYDIVADRRRQKMAKLLESLGDRVQKSVFELYLTPPELEKLLRRAKKFINEKEDNLRVYILCSACRGKARSIGAGQLTPPPGLTIVT
jgi:CRISPR-associated protein Cas2